MCMEAAKIVARKLLSNIKIHHPRQVGLNYTLRVYFGIFIIPVICFSLDILFG